MYWINEINNKYQVKDFSGNIIKIFYKKIDALKFKKQLESKLNAAL